MQNVVFKVIDESIEDNLNTLSKAGYTILNLYPYNNGVIVCYMNLKDGNNGSSQNTQN